MNIPVKDAMEILVTGKQWMWKIEHPTGKREINDLHVPLGQNIKLTMTSEDVIHSFYVPAFRAKMDVVPGRYTQLNFQPTKTGKYHIFCAQYCGTEHSRMGGSVGSMGGFVYVMKPDEYQQWLKAASAGGPQLPPDEAGKALFAAKGCVVCHSGMPGALGPKLAGVWGSKVKLIDGSEVDANEDYIRESILNSQAKIVAGFAPVMPLFKGQLTEEEVMNLIAYIKGLKGEAGAK
jgi:cytochrome c oxidase subunit 2